MSIDRFGFISMGCIIGMYRYKKKFKPRQMKCTFVAEKGVVLSQRSWNSSLFYITRDTRQDFGVASSNCRAPSH